MSSERASFVAGLRLARARLVPWSAALSLIAPIAAGALLGAIERDATPVGATDRALFGLFRWVLPLACAGISGLVVGAATLRERAWPASRFGHAPWLVVGGYATALAVWSIGASVLSTVAVVGASRAGAGAGPAAPSVARELLVTLPIAAIVGFAYASWLALASTFGRRGQGRAWFVAADLALGATGVFALVLPRGAALHLVGHDAVLGLTQRASSGLLVVMGLATLLLCGYRART